MSTYRDPAFDVAQRKPVALILPPQGGPKTKFHQAGLEFSRLLTDDYVQKKFLTVKYAGKGLKFVFNAKGTVDFKLGADKREVPVTSSEVKLITNIEGRDVEAKFDSKGVIRLWSNFGVYNIGTPLNISAKLKTNNAFDRASGNVCFEYRGPRFSALTRLDVKNNGTPLLNEKVIFNQRNLQLGYVLKLNLFDFTLSRYNLWASWSERDYSIYAEHFSKNKGRFELGKVILAGIYRYRNHNFVVKGAYRPYKVGHEARVKAGVVSNIDKHTTVRAKIDNSTKFTLSTKIKLNSNFTVVGATQINLLNPGNYLTKRAIPVPLGLSLEFNYA
jgi:hypothetical protein